MTLEQWSHLPEDDLGEWIDGWLVEEEMPNVDHETVSAWTFLTVGGWLRPLGGKIYGSGVKYVLSDRRGRIPDLSVFLPGSQKPRRGNVVDFPPDIAVEIVSPSLTDQKRDRVEKLQEYAAFGVRYYWLMDPQLRLFDLRELGPDGRYITAVSAMDGVIHDVPGCPGLTLNLDDLWAEIDALEAAPVKGDTLNEVHG